MTFYVYVLRDKRSRLYIGQSQNLAARLERHNLKRGSKYTASHLEENAIVHSEEFSTRSEAMLREKQLKGWTRAKKEALISGNIDLLKKL